MIELEIRVERLRKEQIGDIVALSSYIGWDYNREEIEAVLTQVLYTASGMRERNLLLAQQLYYTGRRWHLLEW